MRRTASVSLVVGILAATGVDVAANVATGILPLSWRPYLWLAWPFLAVSLLAVILIEVRARGHRRPDETASGPAAVNRSVTAAGDINGIVSTGDHTTNIEYR